MANLQKLAVEGIIDSTPEPNLGTKSVENAIAVLLAFADADHPLGVSEIAKTIGMHKSSVSRQLATLSRVDFVKREEGSMRYTLGLGLLPLAAAALAKHRLTADDRVRLETLAKETGETVTFSGWNGHDAVNLDQVNGRNSVQHVAPPGRLNPAHCTATGKVFLANLPEKERRRRLAEPLKQYGPATITDPVELERQLEIVRKVGYAVSNTEFRADVRTIAAPVRARDGSVKYAIAISIPSYRKESQSLEDLKEPLLITANALSQY